MGGGVQEEMKVVDLEDGEGEAAAAEGSSREMRMLPMMPVRVLLAEGDDSTRHVISALLRNCGYRGAHRRRARQFAGSNWLIACSVVVVLVCIGLGVKSCQSVTRRI